MYMNGGYFQGGGQPASKGGQCPPLPPLNEALHMLHKLTHLHYHNNYYCTHIAVIGNKYRSGDREIGVDVAQSYAKSHNMPYIETAAHSGEGVADAFYTLVRLIRRQVNQERW